VDRCSDLSVAAGNGSGLFVGGRYCFELSVGVGRVCGCNLLGDIGCGRVGGSSIFEYIFKNDERFSVVYSG